MISMPRVSDSEGIPMESGKKPRTKRAKDPRQREDQLVSLAYDLAEKQLRDGTASPSTIGHFLKLRSERESWELRKLQNETSLMEAKKEAIESTKRQEELFERVIDAMKSYGMEGLHS